MNLCSMNRVEMVQFLDDLNKNCVWSYMQVIIGTSFSDQSQEKGLCHPFF
jgi:hypothetical protein